MADLRKYVQGQDYTLAGAGVGISDTTIVLNSMLLPNSNELVTMTMFGIIGFATLEPETTREENISFTGITQNGNGTASLTGVVRGLKLVDPYDQSLSLRQSHAGSTILRITNNVQFYDSFANKYDDEDIAGVTWTIDNPVVSRQIANKAYVDAAIVGGGVPASSTTPGISMEATQPQTDAGTATGTYLGNPYQLFVNPAKLRARQFNSYVVDTGAADAYVITVPNLTTTYTTGDEFTFEVTNTNTGTSTLNVNGIGAITIKKNITQDLASGNLIANSIVTVIYDGTNFQIIGSTNTSFFSSGLLHSFKGSPVSPGAGVTTPVLSHTYTIPANAFANGDVIRIIVATSVSANASNNMDQTMEIGGVQVKSWAVGGPGGTIYNSTIIGLVTATTIEFTDFTMGSTGANIGVVIGAGGQNSQMADPRSIAFNPAIANDLEFFVRNNTGNAGANGNIYSLVVEKV